MKSYIKQKTVNNKLFAEYNVVTQQGWQNLLSFAMSVAQHILKRYHTFFFQKNIYFFYRINAQKVAFLTHPW